MNYGIVQRVLGIILIIESSLMLPSLLMSFKEGMETFNSFLFTIIIGYILGFILAKLSEKSNRSSAIVYFRSSSKLYRLSI